MANIFAPWQEMDYQIISGSNPLPSYLSLYLQKNVIAVYINSPTAKPNWRLGGFLTRIVTLTEIPIIKRKISTGNTIQLPLGKTHLIEFAEDFGIYQVEIIFPRWIDTIEIALWQSERLSN
jgi:hypothetical protein